MLVASGVGHPSAPTAAYRSVQLKTQLKLAVFNLFSSPVILWLRDLRTLHLDTFTRRHCDVAEWRPIHGFCLAE